MAKSVTVFASRPIVSNSVLCAFALSLAILVAPQAAFAVEDSQVFFQAGNSSLTAQAATSLASATIDEIPAQTYTGSAITPAVTVKLNGKTLVAGTDYTVAYSNNTNATSAATATITGKGNYTGARTKVFTISRVDFSKAEISAIADQEYTGSAITPAITVKLNGKTLASKDYTVAYSNNTSITDTATVAVTSADLTNYSGTATATFKIKGIDISKAKVEAVPDQDYTGVDIQPRPKVTYKGTELKDAQDIFFSWKNNVNPGTADLTVEGSGIYAGTQSLTFKIKETGTVPQVTATKAGDGQVFLSWKPIYGATRYSVSEKMPNGSYRVLTSNCTYTYGTVTGLSASRTHRFLVRAYVNKKWSSKSDKNLVSIRPSGAKKPKVRGTVLNNSTVRLKWDDVAGASCYSIAVREQGASSFTTLTDNYTGTQADLNQLKKNRKYTYLVRAYVDGKWTSYKKSDLFTISPSDPNPVKVTAVAAKGDGKIKLTWSKSRGAKKYMVQEKLPNGKWKTYTKKLKKRTMTISNLSSSRKHVFRVRAYRNGKWSKVYSSDYATATPDGPEKPEAVAAKVTSNTVKLEWDKVPGAKKYSVSVMRPNGSFKAYTKKLKATNYTIKNLSANTEYRFLVRAYVDGAWTPYTTDDMVKTNTSK